MFHVRLRRICIVLMMAILFLNICQFYSVIQTCISLMIFYLIPLSIVTFFFFFGWYYLFIFREGKGGRKRERHINVWLPLVCPLLGTWPATQACALTEHRTGDPLVRRMALNPLSHTSQGLWLFLILTCGYVFFDF